MSRKYFGTDGIRGTANRAPMTPDLVLKVAMATADVLRGANGIEQTNRVVIGKDTRLSSYMIEQAMSAGFIAMGMQVTLTGPIPTPAVAMLTRSLRADLGVMISASHNPYEDNGIKLFGADGYKLSDMLELQIEQRMEEDLYDALAAPSDLGRAQRLDDVRGRYIEYIKQSVPKGVNLHGLRVVVDCAHGAAYKVAPQVLWELEADVIAIGTEPNGININDGYGATDVKKLQKLVKKHGADIGVALDGDADRLIVVDEIGEVVNGDQLMAAMALKMQSEGALEHNALVATVMSNLGMERTLQTKGITLHRAQVGDRYVVEKMREGGFNLGGEQSGHMVLSDYSTTGDGLLAALQILQLVKESGEKASEVLQIFDPCPQILKNVRYEAKAGVSAKDYLADGGVKASIAQVEAMLGEDGRVLVRPSGTEPLLRVMVEGDDAEKIEKAADDICAAIQTRIDQG